MADKDTRFNVSIEYKITKVGEEKSTPFTSGELLYNNMDYLQISVLQQALVTFAQGLVDIGMTQATAMGFDIDLTKEKK